ncbi:hypothetical protein C5C00_11725 [Rathayibacter rathayi]|uniref:hypothetical protein n=1 Tax=Rathayibacter rathayi TaxID=33887 RepID=UPI000CE91AFD|nr:hypothetical protein [Rathayibacter rathayi]PPG85773.1 hypothetical protein C5C47_13075 [Rathayibacter rathayi]PPG94661.1 hypothetical protein C5C00_11725 [Rathayibacter rathayi]
MSGTRVQRAQPLVRLDDELDRMEYDRSVVFHDLEAHARRLPQEWDTDVRPDDTWLEDCVEPVIAGVAVPELSGRRAALWIECWAPDGGTPVLEGSWGDSQTWRGSG